MIPCYRSTENASKDKEDLKAATDALNDEKLDTTARINKTIKAYDAIKSHEAEKLKSLQDEALFKKNLTESSRNTVKSKAIDTSKAQLKYLDSKLDAINNVKLIHETIQEQERLKARLEKLSKQLFEAPVPTKKEPKGRPSEYTEQLKQDILDVKAQIKETDWKQKALRESAIKNKTARLDRTATELKRRIAESDFAPKQINRSNIETPEIVSKKREVDQLRLKIDRIIEETEYKNRTPVQQGLDFLNNFKRFSILSSPKSLAKLWAASAEVAAARSFTEVIGRGLGEIPVLKEIREMAPIEGKSNLARDANTYFRGLVKGWKERKDIISGDGGFFAQKFGKESGIPKNWMGLPGRIHEWVKNPTRMANYEVGVDRYLRWAESRGLNPKDPVVMNDAEQAAFKYANESIFKNDNKVVEIYQNGISSLKRGGATEKSIAFALEQTLPIVKIPTNILFQTFEYAFGTIPGSVRLVKALRAGVENIKPEEADLIMRNLKRGSAGLALMATGVALSDKIGGLYLTGEEKGEEEYGTAFGIPRLLLENPLFACLQIGATAKRFWTDHFEEAELPSEKVEFFATMFAKISLGLIEEAPFVKSMVDFDKIVHSRGRVPDTIAEIYARPYVPAALQYAADLMDAEEPMNQSTWQQNISTLFSPHATKRNPESVLDVIKEALPYFRQQVPEK